jgi:DMSO/TMAO reductase YedYZ molybdopterin-dependent catalytic subunit
MILGRREMLAGLATATLAACDRRTALAPAAPEGLPFGNGDRPLVAYPGKRPLLRLTARPPQLETPFAVFDEGVLTPNDAFFVRYHLSGLPGEIDLDTYRLDVAGRVAKPLSLSLDALKRDFAPVDLVAVNQCSGNSRGFVEPRVGGGQLGNGAMGNARWTGVPLRAVLDRAGVTAGAIEVAFDGLDGPVSPATPDFTKSLPLDHARDGEVMLAWAQNEADLPFLNGFPLRLVVPGYFGTYWVKHLNRITVLDRPLDSFWMDTAYRVPDNDCQCVPPGTKPDKTRPIGRFAVRSFVTSLADGARVPAGDTPVRGIAFDGGSGIAQVAVSADGGKAWTPAKLGPDLGRYSFRQWELPVSLAAGTHRLMVRATARSGETQPLAPRWNPPGYLRNVVETITVQAA